MGWKQGDVVMEAAPFVHVICQKFKEERCNFCLKSAGDVVMKKCAACARIRYCGVACQKQDWKIHRTECKILQRTPQMPSDSMRLCLRLVIRYVKGDANIQLTDRESPCIRSFNNLMSHSENIKNDARRKGQFQTIKDFLHAYADGILKLPSDEILLEIFGKMVINTFTIADEMLQDVGVAIYNSPSILDHTCWPTAVASFDGNKVTIRAVTDIPSGKLSDVFLSYVDPLATTKERNEQLQEQYYFTCECYRCKNKEVDAMMTAEKDSNPGDLTKVKNCLEKVDEMKSEERNPKDILEICEKCLDEVKLPYGNVFEVRLRGKAFDLAIDAEAWDSALKHSITNYKPYSQLHPPFNPCVGYLLANMGKLLMLVGKLPEAVMHLNKAKENFTVSLGEKHFLYGQVRIMLEQCQAEMSQQNQN